MLEDASLQLSSKPSALKKLGIDEIALIKGQGNYCAVLIDLETSKLITIIPGRTQVDIKKVLISWGTEVLEQIEEVSIDLWRGYKTLVMDLIPNVQVVADRFHVALQVNKELDTQIKRERIQAAIDLEKTTKLRSKKAECQQFLEGLKKSKYSLLKNEQDLNEKQKIKLLPVKNVCPTLKIMHELKEDFRQIFDKTTNWLKALFKLGQWHKKPKNIFPIAGTLLSSGWMK